MKTEIQRFGTLWEYNSSLNAAASVSSGSFWVFGYGRVVGMVKSSASLSAGCGIQVSQSPDGTNWDYESNFSLSACSGSAFSIDVIGKALKITLYGGAVGNAASVRAFWGVRPI